MPEVVVNAALVKLTSDAVVDPVSGQMNVVITAPEQLLELGRVIEQLGFTPDRKGVHDDLDQRGSFGIKGHRIADEVRAPHPNITAPFNLIKKVGEQSEEPISLDAVIRSLMRTDPSQFKHDRVERTNFGGEVVGHVPLPFIIEISPEVTMAILTQRGSKSTPRGAGNSGVVEASSPASGVKR